MRVRSLVVISVVVLALLACGVVVALAAPSGEGTITKAQAEAFAHAVKLRTSDLSGAKETDVPSYERARYERETQAFWAKTVRCARHDIAVHRPILVGAAGSILLDGPWIVSGVVRVMPSEAVAASEAGAFASKRGHVCFARAGQATVTSENEPPKTTFLQLGQSLGAGAIGVHTVTNVGSVLYSDAVLFRVGAAEILFVAAGQQLFPGASEHRLLSLLHSRAEAHKL